MGLRSKANQEIPVGAVWPFYGSTPPPGWLFCDGGSTAGYGALAAQVGANVPDLRGRIPIGTGAGPGLTARTLGATAGAETAAMAVANMPSHNHGGGDHGHTLSSHTHTGGLHGHSATGHSHGVGHDHGPHAHGGFVMTGHSDFHIHQYDTSQMASSPQGYFTGTYVDTNSGYVGYNGLNTAGPSSWADEAGETTGANAVGAGGGVSVTVIAAEGSGGAFGVIPPALVLQFIIKT